MVLSKATVGVLCRASAMRNTGYGDRHAKWHDVRLWHKANMSVMSAFGGKADISLSGSAVRATMATSARCAPIGYLAHGQLTSEPHSAGRKSLL